MLKPVLQIPTSPSASVMVHNFMKANREKFQVMYVGKMAYEGIDAFEVQCININVNRVKR